DGARPTRGRPAAGRPSGSSSWAWQAGLTRMTRLASPMAHATGPQALPSSRTLLCWADEPDNQRAASSVRSSLAYGSTTRDQDWAIEGDPQTLKETKTWS